MSLIDEKSRGVFAIAVTPFTEDGMVDLASVDSMVDFFLGVRLQRRHHPRCYGRGAKADRRGSGRFYETCH